jgi:hypothetical protein
MTGATAHPPATRPPAPPPCVKRPLAARRQIQKVGNELVRQHGKQRYYSVEQVRVANRRQDVPVDVACWSHAFFNTHADFDQLHTGSGEACDYAAMKADLTEVLSAADVPLDTASWLGFDWDLSWLELPSVDWSIFDFLDL